MTTQTRHDSVKPHHLALRFLTAGSVDDGKSTLIGRLLYDSRAILADQLHTLEQKASGDAIDLSLLTDGLEAEREQGITIDVAYRYFATPQRKFIIADAPGHEQYTRNMVTAAAGSDAAVVLVDVTKVDWRATPLKLLPQTRRHALLAHLLRVPSIVFAINKMDALATDADAEAAFAAVSAALQAFSAEAGLSHAGIVPVSALRGDNVTSTTPGGWYQGPSLLSLLTDLPCAQESAQDGLALPVQYVARAPSPEGDANPERAFWGRLARGTLTVGQSITVLPAGHQAVVKSLRHASDDVASASAGQSVGVVLDRHVDVSRGDWIVAMPSSTTGGVPEVSGSFMATLAWLDTEPAQLGRKYWVRHAHQWVQARIVAIDHKIDIQTLEPLDAHELGVNEIGSVTMQLQSPVPIIAYGDNRTGGAMIMVDPATHRTSGALLVKAAA